MLKASVMVLVLFVYTLGSPIFNQTDTTSVMDAAQSITVSNKPLENIIAVNTTTTEFFRVIPTDDPINNSTNNSSEAIGVISTDDPVNSNSTEIGIANRFDFDDYIIKTPYCD